jgi:predicted nuclease of restriction endonuclease-like (RecB) superfamily
MSVGRGTIGDMNRDLVSLPPDYPALLADLKARVRAAQHRTHRAVNTEMLTLYWQIGDAIRTRQQADGWGTKVVDRLAADLRAEFPSMRGLSRSNLDYMRAFAAAWPVEAISQQPAGKLGWGHVMLLIDKLDDPAARDWYAAAADAGGWSRNVLANQIMNRTYERTGVAASNFARHLEPADSELAQQLAKDPYVFDFLGLSDGVAERDLEQALMDRLVQTLRELGPGFAFLGRQVHFDVEGDDFYVDLLLFHTVQLRHVVLELKIGKFTPEHAGQLGFYVALVEDRMRLPQHQPTVGLLLCTDQNETVVRYALGATTSPLAVATYTYDTLPPAEKAALPSEAEMVRVVASVKSAFNVSSTAEGFVARGEPQPEEK